MLLAKLIEYFETYDLVRPAAISEAYCFAAGISLSTIGLATLNHLYFYNVQRVGMRIRVAMCHVIYRKVSRRSSSTTVAVVLVKLARLHVTLLLCKGSMS